MKKSKFLIFLSIVTIMFIPVITIYQGCRGSYEDLEWEKSKKIAGGLSEEEADKAVRDDLIYEEYGGMDTFPNEFEDEYDESRISRKRGSYN